MIYYGIYFDWLCEKINLKPGIYDILIHELYSIEFKWVLELDANRAEDGLILRGDFHEGFNTVEAIESRPCSVLEALIGLAQRMDYILDDEDRGDRTRIWFWQMIQNLGLDKFEDVSFEGIYGDELGKLNEIRKICDKWMNREFSWKGWGSPFPLSNPKRDQRKIHMIDQMNDYILEKYIYEDEIL